jgi:hypothetical protein
VLSFLFCFGSGFILLGIIILMSYGFYSDPLCDVDGFGELVAILQHTFGS